MLKGVWQSLKVVRVRSAEMPKIAAAQEPVAIYSAGFGSALLQNHPEAELLTISGNGLLMALPVEKRFAHDRALATDVTPSVLPPVSKTHTHEAVLAFLNGLKRPFRFTSLPEESLFFAQLKTHAAQLAFVRRWQRAALRVEGSFETWFERNFDAKRRKEFKRQEKRLGEQGALELVREFCVDDYLALEAKGWKGRAGTALQGHDKAAAQFRLICANLAASGQLRFWTLKLHGKAIASLVGIVDGAQAWIFKIAYDEDYAKFSPGVLVVLEATRDFFADGTIKLVDSCAIPGHPMIERIWKDRIAFADVVVAPQNVLPAMFALTHFALRATSQLRLTLKPLYLKLRGRRLS